jgi:hypothetical protein
VLSNLRRPNIFRKKGFAGLGTNLRGTGSSRNPPWFDCLLVVQPCKPNLVLALLMNIQ